MQPNLHIYNKNDKHKGAIHSNDEDTVTVAATAATNGLELLDSFFTDLNST